MYFYDNFHEDLFIFSDIHELQEGAHKSISWCSNA